MESTPREAQGMTVLGWLVVAAFAIALALFIWMELIDDD